MSEENIDQLKSRRGFLKAISVIGSAIPLSRLLGALGLLTPFVKTKDAIAQMVPFSFWKGPSGPSSTELRVTQVVSKIANVGSNATDLRTTQIAAKVAHTGTANTELRTTQVAAKVAHTGAANTELRTTQVAAKVAHSGSAATALLCTQVVVKVAWRA